MGRSRGSLHWLCRLVGRAVATRRGDKQAGPDSGRWEVVRRNGVRPFEKGKVALRLGRAKTADGTTMVTKPRRKEKKPFSLVNTNRLEKAGAGLSASRWHESSILHLDEYIRLACDKSNSPRAFSPPPLPSRLKDSRLKPPGLGNCFAVEARPPTAIETFHCAVDSGTAGHDAHLPPPSSVDRPSTARL